MARNYMFSDRNAASQRRKREDQQIELRRQRTEELLIKRRDVTARAEGTASFVALRERMYSPSLEELYQAAYDCRCSLSVEHNPPIQNIVDADVVPRCVELLDPNFYMRFSPPDAALVTKARIEAAWIITNVASGTSDQTAYAVAQGCVPPLVAMLRETDPAIIDQAVWALGNFAGDCERIRDEVLNYGALLLVIRLIEKYRVAPDHVRLLRNLSWLMANLTRGRNPPPSMESMEAVEKMVRVLVFVNDREIVADCFWCLSYIADVNTTFTDIVLGSPVMQRCQDLLASLAASLTPEGTGQPYNHATAKIGAYALCPMIRMLGNIITSSDEATEAVIQGGFLNYFRTIFYKYDNKKLARVRKEMCWLLSNITAGTQSQIIYVIESDLLPLLIDAISNYELYIRKEAAYAVVHMLYFTSRSPEYLQRLLDNNVIDGMQMLLDAVRNSPELVLILLDAVRFALEAGEKIKARVGDNPVVKAMIDAKLVDEVEDLQDVQDPQVVQKAYNIIIDFFEGEDE